VTIKRETWANLQRAETLLVHAAVMKSPQGMAGLWDGTELQGSDRMYITRFASGFDPAHLCATDYVTRYPFTTSDAVERVFGRLVDKAVLEHGARAYSFTAHGMRIARSWLERVGQVLDAVASSALPDEDARRLLQFDQRIVRGLQQTAGEFPAPIFANRARGLQPAFDSPALWHHWQYVWTMLALDEDAQEYVRQSDGIAPLEWFFRRQLWFVENRPWRARVKTTSLHELANRYAPVAETNCRETWESLCAQGLVTGSYESPELSGQGAKLHDQAELQVDQLFLARWPVLAPEEVRELESLTGRMNQYCEKVMSEVERES